MGRVGCGSTDSQIFLTQHESPIFNICFKNILFTFFVYQLSWDRTIYYPTNYRIINQFMFILFLNRVEIETIE